MSFEYITVKDEHLRFIEFSRDVGRLDDIIGLLCEHYHLSENAANGIIDYWLEESYGITATFH